MDLTEFLLERLAEEEEIARTATPGPWLVAPDDPTIVTHEDGNDEDDYIADAYALSSRQQRSNARHIARHDPARVLAECESKRRIVEIHSHLDSGGYCRADDERSPCPTLCALALPYAGHSDYREEWRP